MNSEPNDAGSTKLIDDPGHVWSQVIFDPQVSHLWPPAYRRELRRTELHKRMVNELKCGALLWTLLNLVKQVKVRGVLFLTCWFPQYYQVCTGRCFQDWKMMKSKGCFYIDDRDKVVSHQYSLKITQDTNVWITIEPLIMMPGGLWLGLRVKADKKQ